jgi:hypothetical protein
MDHTTTPAFIAEGPSKADHDAFVKYHHCFAKGIFAVKDASGPPEDFPRLLRPVVYTSGMAAACASGGDNTSS